MTPQDPPDAIRQGRVLVLLRTFFDDGSAIALTPLEVAPSLRLGDCPCYLAGYTAGFVNIVTAMAQTRPGLDMAAGLLLAELRQHLPTPLYVLKSWIPPCCEQIRRERIQQAMLSIAKSR